MVFYFTIKNNVMKKNKKQFDQKKTTYFLYIE